ncbi:MAG: hypothetical protein A2V64_03585 [Bacteroidetes bacterium RBG_13_43_22]|nr:MAG: hypothetical protein A2V64_03585 [Bacteroidetes bacterium RBG_13_43_22]
MKLRFVAAGIILLLFIPAKNINAIPAFARKYQISCQVCHSPVMPRLKGFGEEFAGNGFRLEEYESPRYFIQTGDDKLSLFRELPLAFRLDGHAMINFDDSGEASFASPFILKILSGGELSDKLSYYFYFLLTEGGEIVGVEDAFLMYRDLLKTGINFYIGQFQASDPLFKGELRYTLEGYSIYEAKPGNSGASLKYERGIMLEKPFSSGTTVIAEVLNGCGLEGTILDKDKYKNYMFRINQELGEKISIGFFAYIGKEGLSDTISTFNNKLLMYGPDIKINFDDKFVLNAQYVYRTDSKVFDADAGMNYEDVKTQGGFAELIYSPKGDMSKWYLTGLLNWVDSDVDALDYTAATLHAGYLLRRNVRLVSEFTYQLSGIKYGKVNVGFVSAF